MCSLQFHLKNIMHQEWLVILYVMFASGDYGSVFSLVTNTELQPAETLMSHALVRCSFDYLWIDNKG